MNRKILVLLLTLAATGCVRIPEGYFGNYQDPQTGAALTLGQNKAELTLADGRKYKATGRDLTLNDAAAAKPGIYDQENRASGMIEVFWLNPVAGTRQEQAGFVWYSAEVLFTYFASGQRGQVPSMQMVHSRTAR